VSTRGQKDDSQIDALTAAGCERIWVDKASGKLTRRPEWAKCFEHLRRGDQLVITRLSRPFRSVRHMTELAAQLDERGIDLIVLKQGIDTTTPAGRFLFHVIAGRNDRGPDQRRHPRRPLYRHLERDHHPHGRHHRTAPSADS
jgi:DNA invertase Pin-like site-specific DNA recombinase